MSATRRLGRTTAVLGLLAMIGGLVPGASLASATLPGRDGRIAFTDFFTGQIFTINPDGTGLTQLTHTDANHAATFAEWTPDGRITFSLVRIDRPDDHARIWIMNADGSDQRKVTGDAPGFRNYDANVTPDGSHIVFARCKPNNGVCAIWIMRSDGTDKRPLTPFRDPPNEAIDFFPAVSPDGIHVAFARFSWNGVAAQVYEMSIDPYGSGSGARAVTRRRLEATSPDYSPDGALLTVSSQAVRPGSHIFSLQTDGARVTKLTETAYPRNDFGSVFSPQGNRIAFTSDRRYDDFCCVDLFVMRADGTLEHRIPTAGNRGVVQVAWGSAPPATGVQTAPPVPVRPAKPRGTPAIEAWCGFHPGLMRAGVC